MVNKHGFKGTTPDHLIVQNRPTGAGQRRYED